MVSRRNVVIAACLLAALPLAYAVEFLTGSYPAALGTMLVVSLGFPAVINRLLAE